MPASSAAIDTLTTRARGRPYASIADGEGIIGSSEHAGYPARVGAHPWVDDTRSTLVLGPSGGQEQDETGPQERSARDVADPRHRGCAVGLLIERLDLGLVDDGAQTVGAEIVGVRTLRAVDDHERRAHGEARDAEADPD